MAEEGSAAGVEEAAAAEADSALSDAWEDDEMVDAEADGEEDGDDVSMSL